MGGFLFCIEIYFTMRGGGSLAISNKIEVIFRSSLASVFGFILSSNIKNSERKRIIGNGLRRGEVNKEENEKKCERIRAYDYGNGNSVQVLIAFITSILSGVVILIIYIRNVEIDISILSQQRDLMCTSIGFLLGESKIRSD